MSKRWTCVGLWAALAVAEIAALVALDGHLLVTSPAGEGTAVVAELPCES